MEDESFDNVFQFEDDLFENNVKETVIRDVPAFVPRNYFPSEKCDEKTFSDVKCNPKLFQYHADYLYYNGKYEEAMEAYIHLETLYKDNSYMYRNAKESIVWCLIKKGSKEEAQNIAQKLLEDSTTFEQQMGSQYLLNIITGKVEDTNTILLRVQSQTESKNVIPSTDVAGSSSQHSN